MIQKVFPATASTVNVVQLYSPMRVAVFVTHHQLTNKKELSEKLLTDNKTKTFEATKMWLFLCHAAFFRQPFV